MEGGETSTPKEGSLSPEAEGAQRPVEKTPEQIAAAEVLARVPEKADDYAFTLSESAGKLVGDLTNDPYMKALREHAKAEGWTQGRFNDLATALEVGAKAGLLTPAIDPAAEMKALGERGAERQKELETHLQALKARNEIDEAMFEEGAFLLQTAAGTKLLEYFKARRGDGIDPPNEAQSSQDAAAKKAAWLERRNDPKYDSDHKYRREVDAAFAEAYGHL